MSKQRRRTTISYLLSRQAVAIGIFLGIITSAAEILVDYFEELRHVDAVAQQVLQAAMPSATQATHQIDAELANEVLVGLFNYDFIRSARIDDEFDKELASLTRELSVSALPWLMRIMGPQQEQYGHELRVKDTDQFTGKLSIELDKRVALAEFYQRSLLNVLIGVVKNTLLALVLFWVFLRFVGRPLFSLIEEIGNVDPKDPRPITAEITNLNRQNEIGDLERATNALLSASQSYLVNLTESQRRLQLNEKKFGDFARAGSDWFWETDSADRVTYTSDPFLELSGLTAVDVIGSSIHQLFTDEARISNGRPDLKSLVDHRAPFRNLVYSIEKSGGKFIHVSISGIAFFSADGSYSGYRGTGTDQTELLESERERERLTNELNHAQKLRAVGQLTGGIAHDFNNLLAVVVGSLELALSEKTLSSTVTKHAEMAIDAAERGAQLTRRLLAYSRQQPLAPVSLEPVDVLSSLDDLLRRSIGEQIALEIVLDDGVSNCFADRQELETVILNLAINARDAMPDSGTLTIAASNARLNHEDTMQVHDLSPGQYVCFTVTDTGTGMDSDTISKAFEPYFTTKQLGSGLGLAMAFGFAKQSQGHIRIDSEKGRGTTVTLYMPQTPLDANTNANATAQAVTINKHRLAGLRVLVVEDQHEVRETVCNQLVQIGCLVSDAKDGADALEMCHEGAEFDILLLDVVLPGKLKGYQLAQALVDLMNDAQVIYMSGYTENTIVENPGGRIGTRVLQKPFSSAALAAKIENALDASTIG